MADQLQLRGGTTSEHSTFTGALREVTVDIDKDTLVVHDNATAGGHPLMRENGSNSALAIGSAGTPSLKFTGDTNTGIYSPGADQVSVATSGTERLRIDSTGQIEAAALGTAAAPIYSFVADTNTGVFSPSADALAVSTGGSERLRITSAGLVGVGTSAPTSRLQVSNNRANTSIPFSIDTFNGASFENSLIFQYDGITQSIGNFQNNPLALLTNNTERLRIDSSGRVGIGTASPATKLVVSENGATDVRVRVQNANAAFDYGIESGGAGFVASSQNAPYYFFINGSERARIDSSGRLLVGTSSDAATSSASLVLQSSEAFGAQIKRRVTSNDEYPLYFITEKARGSNAVQSGDQLSYFGFRGYDGSSYLVAGTIECHVDGTPGANDMPGRLVFSTTADGASSPTERMRISNAGRAFLVSTGDGLAVSTTLAAGTTNLLFYGRHSGTAGVADSGTASFLVFTNGNVQNTNNSYGAISDIKLKENIVDASSQWDDIKALQVRKYNFKEGQTHTQIGLVAQEVELVSPGLVSESPDRDAEGNDLGTVTKSVNYSVLYMKAVKALQEAMERIEQLETEMVAVKAQLS